MKPRTIRFTHTGNVYTVTKGRYDKSVTVLTPVQSTDPERGTLFLSSGELEHMIRAKAVIDISTAKEKDEHPNN